MASNGKNFPACGYERGDWECRDGGYLWYAGDGDGYDPEDCTYLCPHCRTKDYLEAAKEDAESTSSYSNNGSCGTGLDIWKSAEREALEANRQEALKALAEIGPVAALDGEETVMCNVQQGSAAQPVAVDTMSSQFLSDVMTAAGLLSHGKRDKALAERLSQTCMQIRLNDTQPVAVVADAPVEGMPERGTPEMFDGLSIAKCAGYNACHDAFTAWLSKAAMGLPKPLKLSDDVQEHLREGMENATGCEDDDVDFDFANGLEQLLHPLVRLDAVTPYVAKLQAEVERLSACLDQQGSWYEVAHNVAEERDTLRAQNAELVGGLREVLEFYDDGVGRNDENGKPIEWELWQKIRALLASVGGGE